jgi:hypothetical protein
VHVAHVGGSAGTGIDGVRIASSPIDHDAFVDSGLSVPIGAGPVPAVSMSAGGRYAELIVNNRTFVGAAEIRGGRWTAWDLSFPFDTPVAAAGLSPQGSALSIACGASGFGHPAPVVGANLSTSALTWTEIEPAGDPSSGGPSLALAGATDAGARVVAYTKVDGGGEIATSTDGGATWPTRTPLPDGATPLSLAHLPDGGLLLTTNPAGGLVSPDGLTWTAVETTPT